MDRERFAAGEEFDRDFRTDAVWIAQQQGEQRSGERCNGKVRPRTCRAKMAQRFADALAQATALMADARHAPTIAAKNDAMRELLLPHTTILTPNSVEVRRLAEMDDEDDEKPELLRL